MPRRSTACATRAWGSPPRSAPASSARSRTSTSRTRTSSRPASSSPPRSEPVSAPEPLRAELDRLLSTAQGEQRLPSVAACAFRDGEVIWERALGVADVESGEEATTAHAYRVGSITKTFTAACVMQLREEGLVELDAPLRAYVPEIPAGPTVRQALAHASGLQREPAGEIWETMEPPTREQLLAG